jgi:hypothetical protein
MIGLCRNREVNRWRLMIDKHFLVLDAHLFQPVPHEIHEKSAMISDGRTADDALRFDSDRRVEAENV